jgi:multiple sugar transport system permease protein
VSARRGAAAGPAKRSGDGIWGLVYALPAIALVVMFIGYPVGSIVYHSLTRWDGLGAPEWIGLRNYRFLLHDHIFWTALRNNVLFAISVPIEVVGSLVLAYLIHERVPGWRFFRSTFFLPAVFSTVVIGILVALTVQLHDPLNDAMGTAGLGGLRRDWLADAGSSIPIIILVVVWANFGYSVLIYLAGMSQLDPQLTEAARMDGAGPWRILWRVYAPNMRRVIELVLVINTVTAFTTMLTYVYVITRGGPGFSTYSAEYFVYDNAFTFQRLGYASAAGVALALVVAVAGFLQIRSLTRRYG